MSQRHTQRPGEKIAPTAQLPAGKGPEGGDLEGARRDMERLADKGSDATELDTEAAQRLGAQLGNSALAALVAARAGQDGGDRDQGQDEEEELEESGAEEEALDSAIEQALPSFGGLGGGAPGGGAGTEYAPWDVGPVFGGDDDDAGGFDGSAAWRPLPVPPDPDADDDDDVEIEDVAPDDDDAPAPPALDHDGAAALGVATWAPSLLTRGLRHPQRIARVPFSPEALIDTDASTHALGRLRAIVRFVARHGDEPGARVLARVAAVAGEAVFPDAAGMSGATARAACIAEALVERLASWWPNVLEVAVDGRARPWAEQAAVALAADGVLGAPALFLKGLGVSGLVPGPLPSRAGAPPAAVHALALAARLRPLPPVDRCLPLPPPPLPDDPLLAIDHVLAAFTGAVAAAPDDPAVSDDDVRALLGQIDRLLASIGVVQVELAAAALAASPWIDDAAALAVLRRASITLRDAARRAFAAGERVEWALGTEDHGAVRAAARDAQSARERAVRARDAALHRLAGLLADAPPDTPCAAPVACTALDRAAEAFAAGHPADALAPLAEAAALPAGLGRAAASLLGGLHLARGNWDAALDLGTAQLSASVDGEAPFAVADAAITVAAASEDWQEPLRVAAAYLRAVDAGGPLNLLRARWAEEAATREPG